MAHRCAYKCMTKKKRKLIDYRFVRLRLLQDEWMWNDDGVHNTIIVSVRAIEKSLSLKIELVMNLVVSCMQMATELSLQLA